MATLHIRSVPDELHVRLSEMAKAQNRSLSAEVIDILSDWLAWREARERQRTSLSYFKRHRVSLSESGLSSEDLVRRDRAR